MPIVKCYLWAMGKGIKADRVGKLIDDRYLLKQQQIVLDTKPGLQPQIPTEIPNSITPYLKLFPYRLHIPQVYGQLKSPENQPGSEIWLLEYGTVPTDSSGELKYPELLPELTQVWQKATALRQLNWLWQMARLWQPLQSKSVASSLLNPSLLRVNGGIIQLLELHPDEQPCSLRQLGQLWSGWVANSSASITKFLQQLCGRLKTRQISQPEQLLAILDQGMLHCGRSQQRTYQIFTCTDPGPTRDHNEDACYPSSGKLVSSSGDGNSLAIVCDGIGGMDCGEIASQVAIDNLLKEVKNLSFDSEQWNPILNTKKLERSICAVNDTISSRNDSEKRQDRQRMGTTLVMTLAHAHELYLTHVGDSRIYWVTPTGCHQVTVDDDLASREVRLGYALYRDAIKYPTSGALVQALGIESSANLHPTVQRLILDEDCVFLLCSDGLSDFDRVEQYWESKILPILKGETDVASCAKQLLQIANQKNGHDNVTVALVYCQVQPTQEAEANILEWSEIESLVPPLPSQTPTEAVEETSSQVPTTPSSQMPTRQLPPQKPPQRPWALLLTIAILLLGGLCYLSYRLFLEEINSQIDKLRKRSPVSTLVTPSPSASPKPVLEEGKVIKIQGAIALRPVANQDIENQDGVGEVPGKSILKVMKEESDSPLLLLQVCQLAKKDNSEPANGETLTLPPEGFQGWIEKEEIERVRFANVSLSHKELGKCAE
ncbi:MAG: PP2C family serine/threonine-protein phosphatase [Xenococcaceae cyanobacterium]